MAVVTGDLPSSAELVQIKEHLGHAALGVSPGTELVSDVSPIVAPQIVRTDLARSLSWEGGQLDFVNEPLGSAVEQLNRYNSDKIAISDRETSAIQINGVFDAGDSAAFVEAISEAYPIQVRHQDGAIVLSRNAS